MDEFDGLLERLEAADAKLQREDLFFRNLIGAAISKEGDSLPGLLERAGDARLAERIVLAFIGRAIAAGWLEAKGRAFFATKAGREAYNSLVDPALFRDALDRALDDRRWKPGQQVSLLVSGSNFEPHRVLTLSASREAGIIDIEPPMTNGGTVRVPLDELMSALMGFVGDDGGYAFRRIRAQRSEWPSLLGPDEELKRWADRQAEFIVRTGGAFDISDRKVERLCGAFLSELAEQLDLMGRISLPGFGTMTLVRGARAQRGLGALKLSGWKDAPDSLPQSDLAWTLINRGEGVPPACEAGFAGFRLGMSLEDAARLAAETGWELELETARDGSQSFATVPGIGPFAFVRPEPRLENYLALSEEDTDRRCPFIRALVANFVTNTKQILTSTQIALDGRIYAIGLMPGDGGAFSDAADIVRTLDAVIDLHESETWHREPIERKERAAWHAMHCRWKLPRGTGGLEESLVILERWSFDPETQWFGCRLSDELWFVDMAGLVEAAGKFSEWLREGHPDA